MENSPRNNIVPINAIVEAMPWFLAADKETLIIFDVDCVLTMPAISSLQLPTFNKHHVVYENLRKNLTKDERHILNHLLLICSGSVLVESAFPEIIKELQQRNIKSIAMTAAQTGNINDNLCFPDWRYAELKKLGIDFSNIFPRKTYFTDLVDFAGNYPGIDNGIVYSTGNKNSKGDLLEHVFAVLEWQPQRIIAVDDRIKNLQSFAETISNIFPVIEFIGLHYHGADFFPTPDVSEAEFISVISSLIKLNYNL